MSIRSLARSAISQWRAVGNVARWIREVSAAADASNPAFLTQTRWFIDQANGDDDQSGLTASTALASYDELMRRIGSQVGQILPPLADRVIVTQIGPYVGDVLIDINVGGSYAAANATGLNAVWFVGQVDAPVTTDTITLVAVEPTGVLELSTPLVLVAGDIIQIQGGPRAGAIGKVTGAGTVLNYEVSLFQTTAAPPVLVTPQIGDVIGKVTLPQISGELRLRTTKPTFLGNLQEVNPAASARGLNVLDGSYWQFINCNILGATAGTGSNLINDNAEVISNSFFQLSVPLTCTGLFTSQRTTFSGNLAGLQVAPAGRAIFAGGTALAGARHIFAGNPTLTRSYLSVLAGGVVRIGNITGTSGFVAVRGATGAATGPASGIHVQAGGKVVQTISVPTEVPRGIAAALGEGVKIDAGGEYVIRTVANVPAIVPATAGRDIDLGGMSGTAGKPVLYTEVAGLFGVRDGVNSPSARVAAAVANPGPALYGANLTGATAIGHAAAGVYTVDFNSLFPANVAWDVAAGTADRVAVVTTIALNTPLAGQTRVTVQTRDNAGALADSDFFVSLRAAPNGAAMVVSSMTP